MKSKALFLVAVAVWLSSWAVPSAIEQSGFCGDGICQSQLCNEFLPEYPGSGCLETEQNCIWDCGPDPCASPSPQWVTNWGTDQVHGAYQYHGGWGPEGYCQWGTTHTVVQYDVQACVSARQPDRTVCYHQELSWDRRYYPDDYSCCSYYGCWGTGYSCP
jgi:hypothetical protein